MGRAARLPGGSTKSNLFRYLRDCQRYSRGSRRSAQHPRRYIHASCSGNGARLLSRRVAARAMETDLETGAASSTVEQTYKAPELEGWIDINFYRIVGFQLARLFAALNMTPTAVSAIGCICGVIAGHFYYYRDLRLNIFGML